MAVRVRNVEQGPIKRIWGRELVYRVMKMLTLLLVVHNLLIVSVPVGLKELTVKFVLHVLRASTKMMKIRVFHVASIHIHHHYSALLLLRLPERTVVTSHPPGWTIEIDIR